MKKFKFDLSTILFIVLELVFVLDIVVAVCKQDVSLFSYICMVFIAMLGFLKAELVTRFNNKKK